MSPSGHPGEPVGGQPAARRGDHGGAASTGGAGKRVSAARSAECPCRAQAGAPCRPDGDHLARYLRAWQSGALSRESLKHVIDGLDVIAAQAIVPAPAGHAPRPEAALAAANYRRFEDAREAQPGSVPWQHLLQPWQHRETTWDRLRQADAAGRQDGAEAEAGA